MSKYDDLPREELIARLHDKDEAIQILRTAFHTTIETHEKYVKAVNETLSALVAKYETALAKAISYDVDNPEKG